MAERPGRARAAAARYVAPAVLCIIRHGDAVLLLEGARRKRWAGRLQGIGGELQPGEDPLGAALREIREETGLRLSAADVQVKGALHSQGFYGTSKLVIVVLARSPHRRVRSGDEGRLRWVPLRALGAKRHLIPDLYTLIPRVLALRPGELLSGAAVFTGRGELKSLHLTTVRS
ncbi:MAG: NUDIX domain-containing protein [Armatimonadota bacterium]|nr:NUDIX domain-containing protein [Armatimonadota bacterium]MDR7426275.1 NUDIX domain-containing protein [Armatimonadota bacterium]MDR7463317.1 NUDIX domain-containing protein [Armatimonadota bacterium]MDR7468949.1 NUDIX domain-containing protein [Armatimonadota bacterium]MDR7473994.1 NUDIX domain-containing protein [Armatimonadota bacterium]